MRHLDEKLFTCEVGAVGPRIRSMFPRARPESMTQRIVAMLVALAVLVAGQVMHLRMVHADADVSVAHAMSVHTSEEHGLKIGDRMPSGDRLHSEKNCGSTECSSCAASVTSTAHGPPILHDPAADRAVTDSAVRPPERLFRPPIRLS